MKKLIIIILAGCLLIGVPFMVLDYLSVRNGEFNIPAGYEKIRISLEEKARTNETVYTKELTGATEVSFMIQSNSDINSTIKISCDKKLIGNNNYEETYQISQMTGNSYLSPKLLLQPGRYTITVTNTQTSGSIMIGYQEKPLAEREYQRLLKIEEGDLNNPPEGYELAYHSELAGLDCESETVYTLTLDHSQKIGIAAYTNATEGNVSVDFIGDNSNFIGIISPKFHMICDGIENSFRQGEYKIKLTSRNADGEVYIFIKK